MLVSLTVGKVDAGVAVLLTEDKRLIEFPSILLPPDISSGSIVDINVARNQPAEHVADDKFTALQREITTTFGTDTPTAPILRCRNVTQTSVVLEWDPLYLATAELRSLSLYRNGNKVGVIPRDKLCTKISGLAVDSEYTFHLVLRTSAGQFTSERLAINTQKMTDLTGITITPGVMPPPLRESLTETVEKVGAKLLDSVRIDTTHFVCTEPRGQAWEKAVEMNVPVVVPDWIKGCEREGKIVGVRGYYLDADPKLRQVGQGPGPGQSQASLAQRPSTSGQATAPRDSPRIEHTPPTPERTRGQEQQQQQQQQQAQEGGPPGGNTEPPTPPPKATSQLDAGGDAESSKESANGERTSGDDEDAKSDGTEKAEAEPDVGIVDKGKGKMPNDVPEEKDQTSENEAARVAEEDGKFDEVQL